MSRRRTDGLHGVLARFDEPERLLAAAREAREAGYRRIDAFTPYQVEGLEDELRAGRPWVPLAMLLAGLVGAAAGFSLQYWTNVVDYPINVGGRPLVSWPAFVPVTFELGVLFAALTGVVTMLALNGLPRPHHPLFAVPGFERATQDRFFLLIRADDRRFEPDGTRRFLEGLGAEEVRDVPA